MQLLRRTHDPHRNLRTRRHTKILDLRTRRAAVRQLVKDMHARRSHLDHCFNPPGAVGAAVSRAAKIVVVSRATNPNRRAPAAMPLKSTQDTLLSLLSTTCALAPIPIAALQSP